MVCGGKTTNARTFHYCYIIRSFQVFVPNVNTIVCGKTFMITMLIGVDNILNKITKFVLIYICYMFIILCYVFLFTNLSYMELYTLCINILK